MYKCEEYPEQVRDVEPPETRIVETVKDAARFFGVSPASVRGRVKRGTLAEGPWEVRELEAPEERLGASVLAPVVSELLELLGGRIPLPEASPLCPSPGTTTAASFVPGGLSPLVAQNANQLAGSPGPTSPVRAFPGGYLSCCVAVLGREPALR